MAPRIRFATSHHFAFVQFPIMTPSTGGFPVSINRTAAVGVPQQFYLFDELAGVARSAGTGRCRSEAAPPNMNNTGEWFVLRPAPAVIPAEHSIRLIGLGYMGDLAGRLWITTPGSRRIAAGF